MAIILVCVLFKFRKFSVMVMTIILQKMSPSVHEIFTFHFEEFLQEHHQVRPPIELHPSVGW